MVAYLKVSLKSVAFVLVLMGEVNLSPAQLLTNVQYGTIHAEIEPQLRSNPLYG